MSQKQPVVRDVLRVVELHALVHLEVGLVEPAVAGGVEHLQHAVHRRESHDGDHVHRKNPHTSSVATGSTNTITALRVRSPMYMDTPV